MKFPLYRTDRLQSFLEKNWEHWDSKRMMIQKQHDGYGFYLYFAVDNNLISESLSIGSEDSLLSSLKRIENNKYYRISKINRVLENDENN
jgi:hypothetical protein